MRHAWQLYRHGVVAGSKARIAGYSEVQAYITAVLAYYSIYRSVEWLGSRVVSVLDSGAEGPGSNRSRDAVG